MNKDKAIQIVRAMSRNAIENASYVEHKPTPEGVKWTDNSGVVSQKSKHVRVSNCDTFRKYLNRNLLG